MKSLSLKRVHWLWFAPIAAIALLWVFASIGSSLGNPICGNHGLEESGAIPGCQNEPVESRRMQVGPEQATDDQVLDRDRELIAASVQKSGSPRYSERRIRMLNETIPIPDDGPVLLQEMERLTLQQRRFERRYGPESVAARSVRFRLRDLQDHASNGLQYAVENKRATVDD